MFNRATIFNRATNSSVLAVLATLLFIPIAQAQERNDVIWARDIGEAEITLDGVLDEAVWDQAEQFQLVWGERAGAPGSGWRFHGNFNVAEPSDPIDANIRLLRKGNQLYVGASMADKSVGGATGLWNIDGLVIAINNRLNYEMNSLAGDNFFPGNGTGEYILSWWHQADTTAAGLPTPDTAPRFHGLFGSPNNEVSKERPVESVDAWDAVTVVDGTSNDDTHGDDVGYVMEMRIDLAMLGYDADDPEGESIAASITVYDSDYQWPVNQDLLATTKVWLESQWGNNLNEGAALIMTHPDVNVETAMLPDPPGPDIHIQSAGTFGVPTMDGSLDDDVWQAFSPQVEFGYQQTDVNNTLPGFGPWYTFWFRPDLNGMDPNPPVVDPSVVHFKFFYAGDDLYIGADVDDQAISGKAGESGDGFSVTINRLDSLDGDNTPFQARYIFDIDSTGTVRMSGEALALATENPSAIEAAATLKGASTPGDPTDVDEGYQVEIRMNMVDALGYTSGFTHNRGVWLGANLFDTDDLEDAANSYSTRTWWLRERNTGPGAFAYLDENEVGVANEDEGILPDRIALRGNYPNPFNPSTTLQYAIPSTGEVTLQVYDVLGRQVATASQGILSAGSHEYTFEAGQLASGLYLYRIQVVNLAGDKEMSDVGRMLLLK